MTFTKKWYAKIIYSNEGVDLLAQYDTEESARAFADGFKYAKEISSESDDDLLEDYTTCIDQIEPEEE